MADNRCRKDFRLTMAVGVAEPEFPPVGVAEPEFPPVGVDDACSDNNNDYDLLNPSINWPDLNSSDAVIGPLHLWDPHQMQRIQLWRPSRTQKKRSSPSGAELDRHQGIYQLLYADTDGGHEKKNRENKMRRFKPYLPSVIMGNVRSLTNKTDELAALVKTQREYQESSLLCFTETWLHRDIPDCLVEPDGFTVVRADRDTRSGKKRGGGLAVFINKKWCNPVHVTVKDSICTLDIELLAVSLRPYFLPREFSHAIAVIVYIPPSAAASQANDVIHSSIAGLQTEHPSAFITVNGDFNHLNRTAGVPKPWHHYSPFFSKHTQHHSRGGISHSQQFHTPNNHHRTS
ncbi:Protein-lysine N-methyltransferase EFM5 [Dissostichus eleginoides]|uniref:Protein-lysine N-methyltransferase EFM5 n=1 Tax=Dissostichus eleginoides TaxID=100907 RepID=A0AAD9BJI5_DISEL|nr:Protein-lysine N-methyltransferase EFM5 [Dissostichus eleginoides]